MDTQPLPHRVSDGGGFFVFRVKQTKSPKNPVQEKTIRIVFPKEICYT